jgi:hypothetical protein
MYFYHNICLLLSLYFTLTLFVTFFTRKKSNQKSPSKTVFVLYYYRVLLKNISLPNSLYRISQEFGSRSTCHVFTSQSCLNYYSPYDVFDTLAVEIVIARGGRQSILFRRGNLIYVVPDCFSPLAMTQWNVAAIRIIVLYYPVENIMRIRN